MMNIFKKKEVLGWDNVPLAKYLEAEKIAMNSEMEALERTLNILMVLKDKDYSTVPVNEYLNAVKELDFMSTEVPTIKIPKQIELNGHKYNITKDIDKISTAQFYDYSNYTQGEDKNKLIYIISCFLIPDGKKYNDGYELDEVIEDIKSMPFIMAHNIAFFFARQSKKYVKTLRNYLIVTLMMDKQIPMKKKWKLLSKGAEVWKSLESYPIY